MSLLYRLIFACRQINLMIDQLIDQKLQQLWQLLRRQTEVQQRHQSFQVQLPVLYDCCNGCDNNDNIDADNKKANWKPMWML